MTAKKQIIIRNHPDSVLSKVFPTHDSQNLMPSEKNRTFVREALDELGRWILSSPFVFLSLFLIFAVQNRFLSKNL